MAAFFGSSADQPASPLRYIRAMLRCLRPWLLWLLAFALPLQGAAAVLKAGCSHRHEAVAAATAQAHDHAAHAGHAAKPTHADAAHTGTHSGSGAAAALTDCNTCAPCCAAAAPPSLVQLNVQPAPHDDPAVFHAGRCPDVTAGVPERPPRKALARC